MHTKLTVRYFCETYLSGNCYFYKQEMITSSSWDDPTSLQWGRKRPITKSTFEKRKKAGYQYYVEYIKQPPAKVIPFRSKT
ncbi:hypothetical protein [Salipaludibacillus daqingensis]|uniref:hypothetical protein n=1 Tax=Salipaludibacillus daqingensis TaxID=3041001 RepID=UPI0024757649|nr:hypothetical protein [Salipaludibacillus daqingensis]